MKKPLKDLKIDYQQNWVSKHLRSIEINYGKSHNFKIIFPLIVQLYEKKISLFCDFCFEQLILFMNLLEIDTKIVKLSELNIDQKKSDLILEICLKLNASKYIAGGNTMNYLFEESFAAQNIQIIQQEFKPPHYKQLHGDFIENLSVLDFIMNNKKL